jgi:Tfp pilus assembly protein PilO
MLRNSSGTASKNSAAGGAAKSARIIRIVLGVLLGLNLIGAGLVLFPPGGSAEDLERQLASLQSQAAQKRALLEQTRKHASAVEKGRADGDQFLGQYFLARRGAYTALLTELNSAAQSSGIKPRETAYATDPIEGSDTLSMMVITANFEGTYPDLMNFVHAIDASPRLLIIDSLTAAPEQGTNLLAVSLKIDAFVREEAPGPVSGGAQTVASVTSGADAAPPAAALQGAAGAGR